jgi:uncharacterized protein (TIGR03435 family)
MKQTLAAASWIAVSILTASGQGTLNKPDAPEFEVASVKPAGPQDRGPLASLPGPVAEMMGFDGGPGSQDPTRIRYHDVTLKALLARAYRVKPGEISGPGWLGSERYTIEAKLPPGTDEARLQLMLQKLLTERFQMSLHREVKETPVYRLKVARNGPKLKPPEKSPELPQDPDERQAAIRKQLQENIAKRVAAMEAGNGIKGSIRSFGLARATLEKFAEVLSSHLDRPVKDMTQLEGEYSFNLEWTPDGGMRDDSSGVSIFTAIQEQLGLKLEAGNETIELLVIDKAEKVPTSN